MNCANLRNSCIGPRPKSIFAKNERQLLPEATDYNPLSRSTCSLIVLILVSNQMIAQNPAYLC